jgi:hypothetical protein
VIDRYLHRLRKLPFAKAIACATPLKASLLLKGLLVATAPRYIQSPFDNVLTGFHVGLLIVLNVIRRPDDDLVKRAQVKPWCG